MTLSSDLYLSSDLNCVFFCNIKKGLAHRRPFFECEYYIILWYCVLKLQYNKIFCTVATVFVGSQSNRKDCFICRCTGFVGSVGCTPDLWSRVRFPPDPKTLIFSTVILSLLLVQEEQLSVSGKRMCARTD